VRAAAGLETVRDRGPVLSLDGQDGLGHWQLWDAAVAATDRARRYGIAAVSVGNTSHCGALGVYTLPPLKAGLVCLVFSNGPAVMPPWGGAQPLLSTSPIAAGIPCRPRPAIVDLATSAVARGRIAERANRREPIPEGWALDSDGVPTTEPAAAMAGMLAPLGGAKGYALAFMIEALTGAMVGPALSQDVADMFDDRSADRPQRISHLVVVVDPTAFDVDGASAERLDELARRVEAAGGRVPGSHRRVPEEIADGEVLDLAPATVAAITEWAERLGVAEALPAVR
jgi:(2R)-3-sulfolactate dehydrogenase (NADP+)